jgi:hypothetical protein
MTKRAVLVLIVLILGCASICAQQSESSPAAPGRAQASRDIQNKVFIIKAWGLPEFSINGIPTRNDFYQELLLTKFKIQFEWVAGCLIDDETLSYASAYNDVAKAGIEKEFGKDILETVRKEADREWDSKYAEKSREWERKFKETLQRLPKRDN